MGYDNVFSPVTSSLQINKYGTKDAKHLGNGQLVSYSIEEDGLALWKKTLNQERIIPSCNLEDKKGLSSFMLSPGYSSNYGLVENSGNFYTKDSTYTSKWLRNEYSAGSILHANSQLGRRMYGSNGGTSSPYVILLKPCETCGELHNGTFASGRFCSSKCARTVGGLARKKQRLQSKAVVKAKKKTSRYINNSENGEGDDSNEEKRRMMEDMSDSQILLGNERNLLDNMRLQFPDAVKEATKTIQHEAAASLCSLENTHLLDSTSDRRYRQNNEIPLKENETWEVTLSTDRAKKMGKYSKIDVSSLIN
eukprot:jgi/Galph1/4076/GphlegSOOS_G2742.1